MTADATSKATVSASADLSWLPRRNDRLAFTGRRRNLQELQDCAKYEFNDT